MAIGTAQEGRTLALESKKYLDSGNLNPETTQNYINNLQEYANTYPNLKSNFNVYIEQLNAAQAKPNLAPVTKNGVETNAPLPSKKNDGERVGAPTTPSLGVGNVKGTTIDELNNNLAHACDFVLDLKKNIYLKNYIKAIAKSIREGIRAIQRLLGLGDASGSFSTIINKLKAIAQEIKYIQKEYIQPIIDFEKYVLAVLVKIRQTIQWILSLPGKILAMLKDCLNKLISSLKNIFTDALKEAATEVPLGGSSEEAGFDAVIKEAKSVISAGQDLLRATSTAVAGAAAITASATVGLISPVSASEVTEANKTIAAYENSIPTTSQSTIETPSQNKSTP